MNMKQFFSMLRARMWLALAVLLVLVGAGTFFGLTMPKKYTAKAQVLIDLGSTDRATGQAMPFGQVSSYIATQIDIINSPRVALRVVDILKLAGEDAAPSSSADDAEESQKLLKPEAAERRNVAAERVQRQLEVKPARQSSLLDIAVSDPDPARAAQLANAYAQAYIETTVRVRVEPARQARAMFDNESKALRERLDEAQAKLSAYQRASGITSSDERLDIETSRLQELSSQVTALQAATADTSRRAEMARNRSENADLPEVLANPLIQSLKTDQARLERRLNEQSEVLGPNHPEIIRLRQELQTTRQRMTSEIQALSGSLTRSNDVNRARLGDLEAALAAQRAKVLQLRTNRSELANLQRDLEAAQRAYERVNERLNVTSLETKTGAVNIIQVTQATAPAQPSSPGMALILMASALAGAMLAVLLVTVLELMNRKVRGTEDLIRVVDAPVIGELGRVNRRMLLAR